MWDKNYKKTECIIYKSPKFQKKISKYFEAKFTWLMWCQKD